MKVYTIQQGDTLSELALQFDKTIEELMKLNSQMIKDIDLIYTGKKLIISGPKHNVVKECESGVKYHVVKEGDTLSELALHYNKTIEQLVEFNSFKIKDIDLIYIGDRLLVDTGVGACSKTTNDPSSTPTNDPSGTPTNDPSGTPTNDPSGTPTNDPSGTPTNDPSGTPTNDPSGTPTNDPSGTPTNDPSGTPTNDPSGTPTNDPSGTPTNDPSGTPTNDPSGTPTNDPSGTPTNDPSGTPTNDPSGTPTNDPSGTPTNDPSGTPTNDPSGTPTNDPSGTPTNDPSGTPTNDPSGTPTNDPSGTPTNDPSGTPTNDPSGTPTNDPSGTPTNDPSGTPKTEKQNDDGYRLSDGKNIDTVKPALDASEEGREQLPPGPNTLFPQCKVPEFVDSLFIPEHPKDKRQRVLLISEDVRKMILEEAEICQSAIKGKSKEGVFYGLTRLGLMDAFNSMAHEVFLRLESDQLADNYKKTIIIRKLYIANEDYPLPEDSNFGLENIQSRINVIENYYQERARKLEGKEYTVKYIYNIEIKEPVSVTLKHFNEERDKAYLALRNDLINEMGDKISDYERMAIDIAKTYKPADGEGYHFDVARGGYYTYDKDVNIDKNLKTLLIAKKELDISSSLKSTDVKSNSKVLDLKEICEFYDYWLNEVDPLIKKMCDNGLPSIRLELMNHNIVGHKRAFFESLYNLNQSGAFIKEQCLTKHELFHGSDQAKKTIKLLKENSSGIQLLVRELDAFHDECDFSNQIGYFSAYTLSLELVKEVTIRIADFSTLLGNGSSYAEHVNKLLSYIEKLTGRLEVLNDIARSNIEKPLIKYRNDKYSYAGKPADEVKVTNFLIWDETDWKPRNVEDQIYAKGEGGNMSIVECALSSNPDKIIYLRSKLAVFNNEENDCISPMVLTTPEGGVGDGKGQGKFVHEFKFQEIQYKGSIYTSENKLPIEVFFPWHGKVLKQDIFGFPGITKVSTGAQFFRFVYADELLTNQQNMIKPTEKYMHIGRERKVGFDFASAAITFDHEIKLNMEVLYKKYTSDNNDETELESAKKNIGDLNINTKLTFHGFAAVNAKLGADLHIGNMRKDGLGVEASFPSTTKLTGYKRIKTIANPNQPVSLKKNENEIGVGSKVEASAFLGVEIGGNVELTAGWTKVGQKKSIELFKTGIGGRGTLGLSAELLFQCTYHNGKFILVFNISASAGLGLGGKFSVILNPPAISEFIGEIIKIINEPGFVRFEIFDDETFAILNKIMTVSICFRLSLVQVLLLPFAIIAQMEKRALNKDNAYYIAEYIVSENRNDENEIWIKDMPPETLSKLLTILVHYHPVPKYFSTEREQAKPFNNNNVQRRAILKIFEWMGGENPNEQQIRVFENTVQRMGLENPIYIEKSTQWGRYIENLLLIKRFFILSIREEYVPSDLKEMNKHLDRLERDFELYENILKKMTSRMLPYIKLKSSHYGMHQVEDYSNFALIKSNDTKSIEKFKANNYIMMVWDK